MLYQAVAEACQNMYQGAEVPGELARLQQKLGTVIGHG